VSPLFFGVVLLKALPRALMALWLVSCKVMSPVWNLALTVLEFFFTVTDKVFCLPTERLVVSLMDEDKIFDLYSSSRYYYLDTLGSKEAKEVGEEGAFSWLLGQANTSRDRRRRARMDAKFMVWTQLCGSDWRTTFKEIQDRRAARFSAEAAAMLKRSEAKRASAKN